MGPDPGLFPPGLFPPTPDPGSFRPWVIPPLRRPTLHDPGLFLLLGWERAGSALEPDSSTRGRLSLALCPFRVRYRDNVPIIWAHVAVCGCQAWIIVLRVTMGERRRHLPTPPLLPLCALGRRVGRGSFCFQSCKLFLFRRLGVFFESFLRRNTACFRYCLVGFATANRVFRHCFSRGFLRVQFDHQLSAFGGCRSFSRRGRCHSE